MGDDQGFGQHGHTIAFVIIDDFVFACASGR
jgi:hypothetical protein